QRGAPFGRIVAAAGNAVATVDIGALEANPTIEDVTDKTTAEDTPLSVPFNVGDGTTSCSAAVATSNDQLLAPNAGLRGTGGASPCTLTIAPGATRSGTATITVTVSKTVGGTPLTAIDTFLLTVLPVADTPSVSGATTKVETETTSGLVIARNAVDG